MSVCMYVMPYHLAFYRGGCLILKDAQQIIFVTV